MNKQNFLALLNKMFVVKRNGSTQEINIDKIQSKILFFKNYINPLEKVDVDLITEQVKSGLHDGVSTSELDVYTARRCMELETSELEYGILASRILINNHHKNTLTSFKDKMEKLYRRVDNTGKSHPFLDKTFYKFVCTNQRKIEAMIDYQRDYLLDTFGFSTLEQQYINKIDGKHVERPQDLFMKEAIALCMNPEDFKDEKALEEIGLIYDLLSTQKFTYATPTLNNSGLVTQQLSSCFLLGTEDSLENINKTLDDSAKISKYGGGIGIHVSNLRSAGQLIRGTNGKSSGIINFLRMYGVGSEAYNQGGKRKGSFAIFLRDYHPDFIEFIQLKNPIGDENQRSHSLFLCSALSDMFWKAVENDSMWYFVDPEEHKGLDELYGDEFESVMNNLIADGKYKKQMKARDVLREIMKQQFESGVPYIINIDAINRKNNLKHYSTIRSSNLCVSGDTQILTEKGQIPIRQIVEEKLDVKVWNGEMFKPAVFAKTGILKPLMKVKTDDGCELKCTPYHKFYVERKKYGFQKTIVEVEACELKKGDKLMKCSFPLITTDGEVDYYKRYAEAKSAFTYNTSVANDVMSLQTSFRSRLHWLSSYIDFYKMVDRDDIFFPEYKQAFNFKLFCQTLGLNLKLTSRVLKNQQVVYILHFTPSDLLSLRHLRNMAQFEDLHELELLGKAQLRVSIESVEDLLEREDTYCFNEPDTHRGVFNGILTGNCNEITLPSSSTEYGVCNLASLVLSSFVTDEPSNGDLNILRKPKYKRDTLKDPKFDFLGLSAVVQILTRTMDRVIDRNAYPVKEAMLSNLLHRPVGIGCSGLADTCCLLRVPYDSDEGVKLSAYIAETIAFSAYSESSRMAKQYRKVNKDEELETVKKIFSIYEESKKFTELSKQMDKIGRTLEGTEEYSQLLQERSKYCENPCIGIIPLTRKLGVYPSYHYGEGAPISRGEFQWKMWGLKKENLSGMFDWDTLERHIKKFGIRNSLLTAQMPTATTAQIMAVNEGVEPFTTNMYRRAVLSGEFVVFNKHLIKDLILLGIWNENMKHYLIGSGGSIQYITGIPQNLKDLYKTAWDMGQKIGVRHALARGPFLDHSQSFNVFIGNSTDETQRADKLYKTLYYGWKNGLKTGIYYLRTQPAIQAQQFSIPLSSLNEIQEMKQFNTNLISTDSSEEHCLVCGT